MWLPLYLLNEELGGARRTPSVLDWEEQRQGFSMRLDHTSLYRVPDQSGLHSETLCKGRKGGGADPVTRNTLG